MPRMFDIIRGKAEDKDIKGQKKTSSRDRLNKKKKRSVDPHSLNFPREILKANISAKERSAIDINKSKLEDRLLAPEKLISAAKKHGVDNQEKSKEIYENAVKITKDLLAKIRAKEALTLHMDKIYKLLDSIFNQVVLGDSILDNIYENREGEYYLPYHIVNVLILSTVLGLNMGFNKSRLNYLGLASIFYDIGMDTMREMAGQPRKLTTEEHNLMKAHISKSLNIVEKIDSISHVIKETIGMHHERVSGNGYPLGMKSDEINPYAKILGLVDTYEALTHNRPHRDVMDTHKVVKFLIDSLKDDFDTEVIKIFINKMSVYPVGSIVKLDTEEVARVIGVQPGSPLRPVVMILKDAFGQSVKERIIIDLSKQDFPSVKDSI